MTPDEIINKVTNNFRGVVPKKSWGETSLFYNPDNKLPNGVYFCTIKEKDGKNDTSSNLMRSDIFRLSIGVSKETYVEHFGEKPPRPQKGCIVNTGHDFTKTNILLPHPVYAWMSWVCVLSPSNEVFEKIYPLIVEAHNNVIKKFNKKIQKKGKFRTSHLKVQ
jgi:hypothetical protein